MQSAADGALMQPAELGQRISPGGNRGLAGRLVRAVLSRPYLSTRLSNRTRVRLWNRLGARIDETAHISPEAALLFLVAPVTVGPGSLLGPGVEIHAWAKVTIGSCVLLSYGAKLFTGGHNLHSPDFEGIRQPIVIQDYAWVAAHALLLPGTSVGRGAVVGAGAVVTGKVPDYAVMAGNPARIIGERKPAPFRYIPANFP